MLDELFRHPYLAALCILLLLAAAVVFLYLVFAHINNWFEARSELALRQWARSANYDLLKHERKLDPGPFSWLTTWCQTVFHVTVVDDRGHTRRGWVRCGNMLIGVVSLKAEVRWDDEIQP